MKAANYYGVYLLMVIFLLPAALSQAAAAEEGSWIDRDNFPEAYGILTSDACNVSWQYERQAAQN